MAPRSLLSNVTWNIVAGLSAAVVNVALPPILTRLLPGETFGAWAFCLQLTGYIMFLNLGLQVIVGRFVANAEARHDRVMRDEIASTAFALMSAAGLIGILLLWVCGGQLDHIVPDASEAVRGHMRIALILLSIGFALMLPTSVLGAIFVGLRRNALFAATVIPMRIATFVVVLAVCWVSRDVVHMALGWLGATIAGSVAAVWIWRRWCPQPRLSFRLVSTSRARQLLEPALVVTLWNLVGLFIVGLQLVLVARFDYPTLGAFASATALTMLLSGVSQALASATGPEFAHLHAKGQGEQLVGLLFRTTRFNVAFGALLCLPLIAAAPLFMFVWAGRAYTPDSGLLLATLVLAQFVRNAMPVYYQACLAIGLQGRMIAVPLVEAAATFGLAVLLAPVYGAIGIAFASVGAAVLAAILHLGQNVLGTQEGLFRPGVYLARALALPAVGAVAAFAVILGAEIGDHPLSPTARILTFLVAILLTFFVGIDRKDLGGLLNRIFRRPGVAPVAEPGGPPL